MTNRAFEMRQTLKLVSLILVILIVLLAYAPAAAQTNDALMNRVILDVLKAEMAGATPDELSGLLTQLNGVLGLQNQLQNATLGDATKTQLQMTIRNQLASIDVEANQLSLTASHRTYMGHLTVYVIAMICAMFAAFATDYALSLNRRLKTRSILEWKITTKSGSRKAA